jgi:hypothetical protein
VNPRTRRAALYAIGAIAILASAGLLRIGAIEPWALWLDSRPWTPAP